MSEKIFVIPPKRTRYLSEISDEVRNYRTWADGQAEIAGELWALKKSIEHFDSSIVSPLASIGAIDAAAETTKEPVLSLVEAFNKLRALRHFFRGGTAILEPFA